MIDSRQIKELHPALQRAAAELINRCSKAGIKALITSTYRDYECQNRLYAQGRSLPGRVVTNAKGGQSIHNYRLAFDFVTLDSKNAAIWASSHINWNTVGKIGMEMGLEWGGSWKSFIDKPHFQYTGGLSLQQLQNGQKLPENVRLPWEIVEKKLEKDKIKVLYNNTIVEVEGIFRDDTNYVKIRELDKFGLKVEYDTVRKIPIIRH